MICCGYPMREAWLDGDKRRPVWLCLACDRTVPIEQQMKLPGLQPGKQAIRTRQMEKNVVRDIRSALLARGYRVLRVGQYRADLGGNDAGAPDLLIGRDGSPLWLCLEVKRPGGRRRPEQELLEQAGCLVVVDNVDAAIEAAERKLG